MKRVFAVIGFTFALTLIVLNFAGIKAALAGAVSAGAAFLLLLIFKKAEKALPIFLCIFSVAAASLIFCVYHYSVLLPQMSLDGETVKAEVYIVDLEEPVSDGSHTYTVKTKSIDFPNAPQNIKLTLYSDNKLNYDYYEVFDAEISLFSFAQNAFDSAGNFDDNVFLKASLKSKGVIRGNVFSLNKYVLRVRAYLREQFSSKIGGDNGALALAVLTGDKCYLSSEAYYNFKACGVTHLMAVSGLHLSVLAGLVYFILKKLCFPKIPAALVSSGVILFYIALSGFSKSMIRAGVMMLVFLLAGIFKEKSDTLNSLGFAAFLVCLNPYAVTDAGALLTFTAVLGLALIRPCFSSRILHKSRVIGCFSDIFLSTVSVFITTFPVMYFMFGAVSLAAFVINLILIPLTDVLLVCGVLFAALSDVNRISDILIFVIKSVTGFMLKTVDVFADFKYSAVSIDSPVYALAISAVFLIFGIGFLFKKENTMKLCALFSAAVFAFSVLTVNIVNRDKTFVRTVSGSYSTCVIAYDREYCLVIGCREYNQYYTAQNIISSNSLKLVLVGENSASLYSAFLANNFDAMNFIGTESNEFLNENINISDTDYFDVDLWQGVNVKYTYENEKQTYVITAGGTSLIFNGTVLNSPAEQDALYTIDKNGYSLQGVNKWLK